MEVEWDGDKAAYNLKNHGVDFADAATVLLDDMAITIRDDSVDEEERFITLGLDATARLPVVAYIWRADNLRLISARPATGRTTALRKQEMKKEYDFSRGKRGAVIKTPSGKTRITIRIDDDILSGFAIRSTRLEVGTTRR